jgi:hypothetical protein
VGHKTSVAVGVKRDADCELSEGVKDLFKVEA